MSPCHSDASSLLFLSLSSAGKGFWIGRGAGTTFESLTKKARSPQFDSLHLFMDIIYTKIIYAVCRESYKLLMLLNLLFIETLLTYHNFHPLCSACLIWNIFILLI